MNQNIITGKRIGILPETLLLSAFLFPAGFGFFAVMLELSLPGTAGVKAASLLIIALTVNRVGRMFSAAASILPFFKKYDVIVAGLSQGAGLLSIYLGARFSIPYAFVGGAFFMGIGLAAWNVFFRTLLTSGASSVSSAQYSVLFYVLWGSGVAFAGLIWSFSLQFLAIPLIFLVSFGGVIYAQGLSLGIAEAAQEDEGPPPWRDSGRCSRMLFLSAPAAIVACVAILFNAALVPLLTNKFGFSVAGTGFAACFIVLGNIAAIFKFPVKPLRKNSALTKFAASVFGNIILVISLFALNNSKMAALLIIIGIGWLSALSLNFQMDFIRLKAGKNMHRAIHAVSEALSVACGFMFAFISGFGVPAYVQFAAIGLALFLWAIAVSERGAKENYNA